MPGNMLEGYLTELLIVIGLSFLTRTLAHMISYSLSYGQLFGFLKLRLAEKYDKAIFLSYMHDIEGYTDGYNKSLEMYNALAHRFFLIALLDCVYCIGFWVSLLVLIGSSFFIGWYCILIPILTYFFLEKI